MPQRSRLERCFVGVEANDGGGSCRASGTPAKSTGVKAYPRRRVGVFGRRAFVVDVKREYPPLAAGSAGR